MKCGVRSAECGITNIPNSAFLRQMARRIRLWRRIPHSRTWIHRYIQLLAAITFLLILAGGLVTSTQSGLSVPDWPLSYGTWMPPMVGGIRFEHTHRMIAGSVGLMTLILAVWMIFVEKRKWVRRLAIAAFGLVVTQGILGGMTVLFLLPAPVSILHACLAQTFFAVVVALAFVTSKEWLSMSVIASEAPQTGSRMGKQSQSRAEIASPYQPYGTARPSARPALGQAAAPLGALPRPPEDGSAFFSAEGRIRWGGVADNDGRILLMTTALIYLQLILGAALRHTGNHALAISHIVTGFLVLIHAVSIMLNAFKHPEGEGKWVRPAIFLGFLTLLQMSLGIAAFLYTVMLGGTVSLTAGRIFFVTAHQSVGALLLAVSVFLALRAWRMEWVVISGGSGSCKAGAPIEPCFP
jgi:heme a synthase